VEVITPFTAMKIVWETAKLPDWPNPTLESPAEKLSYLAVTSLSGKKVPNCMPLVIMGTSLEFSLTVHQLRIYPDI
jgi:hypothetical protein